MHILISAYECKPHAGTEAGNGWGWATSLASRGMDVHVLTIRDNQEAVERELTVNPVFGLSFSFVEAWPRGLKIGHGPHYLAWQFAALRTAQELHRQRTFDLAHHVTYGSIHVPSQLWRLGIPVIFGPVGGGQISPRSMQSYFGSSARKERVRSLITRLLPFSPLHRRWIRKMAVVCAGNEETATLARRLGSRRTLLSMDTGLPPSFFADQPRFFEERDGPLSLLWTGRMMPRKALPLTLDALARVKSSVKLTILGEGYSLEEMQDMLRNRGIEEKVCWSGGRVPWLEVRDAYRCHDAFFFTSLRDSCGSQLLEAMALGTPIITLDHQGAHSLVPDGAGFKVPVTTQEQTISALADAIDQFAKLSLIERNAMSACGLKAARRLAWNKRAARAESLYRRILAMDRNPKHYADTQEQLTL